MNAIIVAIASARLERARSRYRDERESRKTSTQGDRTLQAPRVRFPELSGPAGCVRLRAARCGVETQPYQRMVSPPRGKLRNMWACLALPPYSQSSAQE